MKAFFICLVLLFACPFAGAQWVQTNGPPGGTNAVGAIMITGGNILAGTYDNGMYLSRNQGVTWTRIERDISTVYSFVVSGEFVFAGTRWGGALRSSDHGVTWTRLTNGIPDYIETFAVNGNKIYAGLHDVYLSTDQGESWTAAEGDSAFNTGVGSLTSFGNKLFAAHYDQGVFLSTDDGHSWTDVTHELAGKHIITLTHSGDYIFAGTWDDGVYRSADNGASWTQVNAGLTNLTVTSFLVSGTTLFAGTINGGVCRTDNNGDLWTKVNAGLNDYLGVLAIGAEGPDFVLGTNGGEIYASGNGGNSWNLLYGLPCTWVSSLAVLGTSVFAGTFNDGLFRSTNNGVTWMESGNDIPFWLSILTLMVNETDIYAGTSEGIYGSSNDGHTWKAINNGFPDFVRINSILIDGASLYAGTTDFGVYKSMDEGASWTPVNNGLSNMSVSSLAAREGSLFAGTGDGVFKSTNNGSSWTPVNQGLTDPCINTLIAQGLNIIAGAFCGGGIFVSSDDGGLWTQQLADLQITSLITNGSDVLTSSYSGQLFLSHDDGVSWMLISDGLLDLSVSALAVSGTNLFAGTTEDGVFINSTILSGLDAEITYIPSISLYPNPSSNIITIALPDLPSDAHLSIFTINGQKVLDENITELQTNIDINHLPAGAYFLRYTNGKSTEVGKLIKE